MVGLPGMPPGANEETPVFVISVAARLSGMHAQTLRSYDRQGLVSPGRTPGGGRRYSVRDIALLREVQRLSQSDGVNLAGIKRIIELENQVDALRSRVAELTEELAAVHAAAEQSAAAIHRSYRHELVPFRQETALVVWKPPNRGPRR
ncbi:MerR family transcriptional regulator/heat shock protein HspR [Herbihabitans rhizosphaerae]|uniref:MerR family transcriptional regulator/heat shock protein HspR n=1 Tax=Herbihabitans rhizosphaerae TaxID=1872711 RepID=A0A4Q7KNG0_9PSEU|nr:helix-turn-helix transcriptional regulator [Herbihabitans rhizosphaerae]RZS37866.1 MerR family transcriptional regulator/heat shock protein HspR [Herbihabitans rhizosphaerae]